MGSILSQNLIEMLNVLLSQKPRFPLLGCVQYCLSQISSNKSQVLKTFNHLTDVLNNPEHIVSENIEHSMMNATLFIGTMMEQKSDLFMNLTQKYFPQIFCTYLLRISTSFDINYTSNMDKSQSSAIWQTLWSFQKFLNCSEKKEIMTSMECGLANKIMSYDYDEALIELINLFCKNTYLEDIHKVHDFMVPFLQKKIKSQKLTTIITLSQLITAVFYMQDDLTPSLFSQQFEWLYSLIQILIENVYDKDEFIRKHCFKGIGNVQRLLKHQFNQNDTTQENLEQQQQQEGENYENEDEIDDIRLTEKTCQFKLSLEQTQSILNSLFNGLEDISSMGAKEALSSVQKLIDLLNPSMVKPNLLSLLLRLPENFEKNDIQQRVGAFNLLGKIASLIEDNDENFEELIDNLHYYLISILIHLNDENPVVKQSCIKALSIIATLFKNQDLWQLTEQFSEANIEEKKLLDKTETFQLLIIQNLWQNYVEKIEKYINSICGFCSCPDPHTKATAGFLLCCTFQNEKQVIELEKVYEKLNELIIDEQPSIKCKIIKGLDLISNISI